MIKINNVIGTMNEVILTEFGFDIVYVRQNINRTTVNGTEMWKYDEIQYDYNEWVEVQDNKISILTEKNNQLEQQVDKLTEAMKTVLSSEQIELLDL